VSHRQVAVAAGAGDVGRVVAALAAGDPAVGVVAHPHHGLAAGAGVEQDEVLRDPGELAVPAAGRDEDLFADGEVFPGGNPVLDAAFAARLTACLAELPDEELLKVAETVIACVDEALGRTALPRGCAEPPEPAPDRGGVMGQQRKTLTPERSAQDRWGWELRARRDRQGLSLAELGGLARYDPSYLARLERGVQFPSENAARACDKALSADGELIRLRQAADRERRQGPPAVTAVIAPEPAGAENLPPFGEDAGCLKCASGTVRVTYHADSTGGFPCGTPGRAAAGEHLCRACERCGYGWCEAPADTRPARRPALRLVKETPASA
jgi:transcriptional regulator with XRE-family HTH domain